MQFFRMSLSIVALTGCGISEPNTDEVPSTDGTSSAEATSSVKDTSSTDVSPSTTGDATPADVPEQSDPMPTAPSDAPVTWWADPALRGQMDALDAGIAYWHDVGVEFTRVDARERADVRFSGTQDLCDEPPYPDDPEAFLLGGAQSNGEVFLCIANMLKKMGSGLARLDEVVAHETGHTFGVAHFAPVCDDTTQRERLFDADGTEICGLGVMNPIIAADPVARLTGIDMDAFSVRTVTRSVLPFDATNGDADLNAEVSHSEWHLCYARSR